MANMLKRLGSLALALIMVLSLVPVNSNHVHAAETKKIGTLAELKNALKSTTGGTYEFTADITADAALSTSNTKAITLDFKGHTLTLANVQYPFVISKSVTLKDSTGGEGGLRATGDKIDQMVRHSGGTLTIASGKHHLTATKTGHAFYTWGTCNVNGGTISTSTSSGVENKALTVAGTGVTTINGGTIKAEKDAGKGNNTVALSNNAPGATMIVNGGTIYAKSGTSYAIAIRPYSSKGAGSTYVHGGTFTVATSTGNVRWTSQECDAPVYIDGGTFKCDRTDKASSIFYTPASASYSVTVTGGRFVTETNETKYDIQSYLSAGYYQHTDGTVFSDAEHPYYSKAGGQAPTCTEDGVVDYYKCQYCDYHFYLEGETRVEIENLTEWLAGDGVIDKLGHSFSGAGSICANGCGMIACSEGHTKGELIPALPHTCDEDGYIAHYICTICGTYMNEQEQEVDYATEIVVPAAHTAISFTPQEDSTYEADGLEAYWYCSACQKYYEGTAEQVGEEITAPVVIPQKILSAMIGEEWFDSLQAAIDAAGEDDVITVMNDLTYSANIKVAEGKKLTIDLNGKQITMGAGALQNKGALTLKDSKTGGGISSSYIAVSSDSADLTVEGGTYSTTSAKSGSVGYAVYHNGGTLTIKDGTFLATASSGNNAQTIRLNSGTLNLTGGHVQTSSTNGAIYGIYVNSGTANISGVSIDMSSKNTANSVYGVYALSTTNIKGNSSINIEVEGNTGGTTAGIYLYKPDGGTGKTLTVENTTITVTSDVHGSTGNPYGIYGAAGTVNVKAGTTVDLNYDWTGTSSRGVQLLMASGGSTMNISGGNFTVRTDSTLAGIYGCYASSADTKVEITGGTFQVRGGGANASFFYPNNDTTKINVYGGEFTADRIVRSSGTKGEINVHGGTFIDRDGTSVDMSAYYVQAGEGVTKPVIAEVTYLDEPNKITVCDHVDDFAAAVNAYGADGKAVVKLLADVTDSTANYFNYSFELDLNNKTWIQNGGTAVVVAAPGSEKKVTYIHDGYLLSKGTNTVSVNGGALHMDGVTSYAAGAMPICYSTVGSAYNAENLIENCNLIGNRYYVFSFRLGAGNQGNVEMVFRNTKMVNIYNATNSDASIFLDGGKGTTGKYILGENVQMYSIRTGTYGGGLKDSKVVYTDDRAEHKFAAAQYEDVNAVLATIGDKLGYKDGDLVYSTVSYFTTSPNLTMWTTEHTYDKDATCTTGPSCSCGAVNGEPNGHAWTAKDAVAATCTAKGNVAYFDCDNCDLLAVEVDGEKVITAWADIETALAEHTYGETWTCGNDGTHYKDCTVCGNADARISQNCADYGVSFGEKAPTCTESGFKAGTKCSVCDYVIKGTETDPALGHNFEGGKVVDTFAGNCQTESYVTTKCARCDVTETVKGEKNMNVHTDLVKDNAVPATCTATGLTEGEHCAACNTVTKAQTETPALGHNFEGGKVTETFAGNCQTESYVTTQCIRCDVTETVKGEKNMNVHTNLVKDNAVPATCTATGLTEGEHCAACNTVTKAQTETPALEHAFTYTSNEDKKTHTIGCERGDYTATGDCADADGNKFCDLCGQKLIDPKFTVDGVEVETLDEALALAVNGSTIKLLDNVVLTERLTLDKELRIDLEGYSITGAFEDAFGMIYVKKGAVITFVDGLIENTADVAIGNYGFVIVATDATVKGNGAGIYNFYFNGDYYGGSRISGEVNAIWNSGELVISEDGVVEYLDNSGYAVVYGTVNEIYAQDGSDAPGVFNGNKLIISDVANVGAVEIPEGFKLVEVEPYIYKVVAKVYVAEANGTKYETLAEAIAADGEIKLLADVTEETLVVAVGETIDLNGHTLTADIIGATIKMNGGNFATSDYLMVGKTAGKYTSSDAVFTIAANETMDMTFISGTVTLNEELWYTLEGQTLTVNKGATFVIPEGKTLYVNGSNVVVNGTAANFGTLVLANGAHLKGDVAGTFKMAGGTFETSEYVMIGATSGKYLTSDAVFTIAPNATLDMTVISGTITLNDANWWTLAGQTLVIAKDAKFVVPAGKNINVQGTVVVEGTAVTEGTVTLYNANATIKAAADLNVVSQLADYAVVYANGTYSLAEAAAKIGNKGYITFAEAWAAAQAGDTVTLLKDISASQIITIDKAITLDGNGKTLTSTAGRAINVSGADGVVIKNLTVNASGERAINVIQNATNLTLDNVTATAANYTVNIASSAPNAAVAIKNSTLNGLCTVNVSAAGAKVTVDNSAVNCNDNNTTAGEGYAALSLNREAVGGSIVATNTTVTVAAGSDSFKGRNGAENGTVTINGSTEDVVVMVAVITYAGQPYYHSFASLAAAIEFAKAGDTITLIRDVSVSQIITVDKAVTINGNGMTLTSTAGRAINIDCAGEVTINDLTIVGGTGCERGINVINKAGTTNLNNLTVSGVSYYAVHVATSANAAKVNIADSNLSGWAAVAAYGNGTVVNVENSALVGTNTFTGNTDAFATVSAGTNVTINVTGGSITAVSPAGKASQHIACTMAGVTNATFVLDTELNFAEADGIINTNVEANAIAVRETYAQQILLEGYMPESAGAGMVAPGEAAVAAVNGQGYTTLQDALDAAEELGEATVVLVNDMELKSHIMVYMGVTLDLNGHSLITTKTFTVYGDVIDGAEGGYGLVKASKAHIEGTKSYLSVYDTAAEGYRFFAYEVQNLGYKKVAGEDKVKFGLRISLSNAEGYRLLSDPANGNVGIFALVSWNGLGDGNTVTYSFKAETVAEAYAAQYANPNKTIAMTLTLNAVSKLGENAWITMVPAIATATGVVFAGDSCTWTSSN